MDEMPIYEAELYLTNSYFAEKESWERTRLQVLVTAQANSKKRLKATDILKFPWENSYLREEIDVKQLERLEKRAKLIEEEWRKKI